LGAENCRDHRPLKPKEKNQMPIIVKDNKKDFTPAPEGLQQAVCCDVIEMGEQPTPWGPKEKIEIRWQSSRYNSETQSRYIISARYTASLHEKSNLRQHLESWRGKPFGEDEIEEGFDLEKLIGANCQIQVIHQESQKGRTYAKVQTIVAIMKGPKIEVEDYVRQKDYDEHQEDTAHVDEGDAAVPF
jgi:hypothetical protein